MKRILLISTGLLLLVMAAALMFRLPPALEAAYEPQLSPLAKAVLRERAADWKHIPGRYLMAHALGLDEAPKLVSEADFAYERVGELLRLPARTNRPHLFLIRNERVWRDALQAGGVRAEGVSVQNQDEVYVLYNGRHGLEPVLIPHEMVHLRLWETYGRRLPLWLEEGLALSLAWQTAGEYRQTSELRLVRNLPALDAASLLSVDDLTRLDHYPSDQESLRAFYRQAEGLVRGIRAAVPNERWPAFLERAAGEPEKWAQILQEEFGCSQEAVANLEPLMRDFATSRREE